MRPLRASSMISSVEDMAAFRSSVIGWTLHLHSREAIDQCAGFGQPAGDDRDAGGALSAAAGAGAQPRRPHSASRAT
ncbi:MAG: hypothetical protein Kow0045_11600 [Albidovulum sp.]